MPTAEQAPAQRDGDASSDLLARIRSRRMRRRRYGTSMTVNIAPLIDMSFTMLIFFLVTTRFDRPEGILASELPRHVGDAAVPTVALPFTPIVVRLSQTGPGDDDYAIRIDRVEGEPATFDTLPAILREFQRQPGFDADTPVVIVAENDVRWDHVVNGWNAAIRAGCRHVAFGEP